MNDAWPVVMDPFGTASWPSGAPRPIRFRLRPGERESHLLPWRLVTKMEVDELQLVVPGFQKLVVTLFDDRPVIRTVLLHPQFLVPVFEFHGEVTKGADQTALRHRDVIEGRVDDPAVVLVPAEGIVTLRKTGGKRCLGQDKAQTAGAEKNCIQSAFIVMGK